jgi:hypothetical protein
MDSGFALTLNENELPNTRNWRNDRFLSGRYKSPWTLFLDGLSAVPYIEPDFWG